MISLTINDPEDFLDALERAANDIRYDQPKLAKRLDGYAQMVVDIVDAEKPQVVVQETMAKFDGLTADLRDAKKTSTVRHHHGAGSMYCPICGPDDGVVP